jgi:glycosyltransferase involved in cell wall biosynthesis
LKIHFSNVDFSSSTGPNTFGARLSNELLGLGHEIVDVKEQYDTFLAFIQPGTIPRPDVRTIQRLDGIWFKPHEFQYKNHYIKWAYDNFDYIVWQSEFDKKMTEHHWGPRAGEVLRNGIRLDRAIPSDENLIRLRTKYDHLFVCSSNWHRQKRLKENISLFLNVKKNSLFSNSGLIVLGNNPDHVVDHPDIFYAGSVPHSLCLEIFSAADWMIHLAWLDHCPNVVIEALSQSCPVICSSSGGTKEIVKDNGLIIPEDKEYKYELLDYDSPYELDVTHVTDLPKIDVKCDYLDIQLIAKEYERICSSP